MRLAKCVGRRNDVVFLDQVFLDVVIIKGVVCDFDHLTAVGFTLFIEAQ